MKLRDILRVKGHHVYTVRPDQTVQDAVQILMQHRVGALLVEDAERRAVGIITERDVLRECVDRAAELSHVPVREAMTRDLIIGVPDDEIGYTMGIMTQNRIRHLPVMDGDHVAGMISIGDVVKATLDETEYENRYLKEYIQSR
ncbi:MAG TPA: CBS domain-containing protein [Candidatus Polarisedimenticolia bacterium]|nr:CBS domain-containing protein [Candidatus Polarisedimenticolia bacterium]